MIGTTLKGLTLRYLLLLETTNCMQLINNTMHNIVWIMSGIILKARYYHSVENSGFFYHSDFT